MALDENDNKSIDEKIKSYWEGKKKEWDETPEQAFIRKKMKEQEDKDKEKEGQEDKVPPVKPPVTNKETQEQLEGGTEEEQKKPGVWDILKKIW